MSRGGLYVLVVLCALVAALGEKVITMAYNNSEVTPYNPTGNREYHCISTNNDGTPYYVRGTYGQRGYFEGYFSQWVANVNFWEITMGGKVLSPSTGVGVLAYSADFSTVEGYYWNAGESDIYNSTGDWGITDVCEGCFDDVSTLEGCFYDASNELNDEAVSLIGRGKTNNVILGAEGSPNVFNHVGLGGHDVGGHVVGGYIYEYSDEECTDFEIPCGTAGHTETGHYGINGISANGRSLNIISTTWTAATGPAAGGTGSALYAIVPIQVTETVGSHKVSSNEFSLVGWFCNLEDADMETLGVQLTGCTVESGDYLGEDKAEAIKLMAPYNSLVQPGNPSVSMKMLQSFTQIVWPRATGFLQGFFESRRQSLPFLEYFYSPTK